MVHIAWCGGRRGSGAGGGVCVCWGGGGGARIWGTGQLPTSTHGFDVAVNTVGP